MNFKGLFLILAVFLCSLVACNAVSAANHTVVWQDNRNGEGTSSHIYYKSTDTGKGNRISNTDSNQEYPEIN